MGRMNKFVTLKYTKCEVLLKSSEVMKLFQFEIQKFKRILYGQGPMRYRWKSLLEPETHLNIPMNLENVFVRKKKVCHHESEFI